MNINESTGLYGNYGVWHVPVWQTYAFLLLVKIAIFTLLLLLIRYGVVRYVRYKKNRALTPTERLQKDLVELKSLLDKAHQQEFYILLSAMYKRYLLYCYRYPVAETTDSELVAYLTLHHDDKEFVSLISQTLEHGQMIKFAQGLTAHDRMNADYQSIYRLLQSMINSKS